MFKLAFLFLAIAMAASLSRASESAQDRSFFTTFTLITGTSTTTTTSTSVTTCTTSATALSTCSPNGRRRSLFFNERDVIGQHRRGLYYSEDDAKDSIFLPISPEKRSVDEPKQTAEPKAETEGSVVGLKVESGFSVPADIDGRFGLTFGMTTTTTTTTSTSTVTVTALCISTTSFSVCGSTGK